MNTLAAPVPSSAQAPAVDAVRVIAATSVGGLVGSAAATALAVAPAAPVLVGMSVALLAASRFTVTDAEGLAARGPLAIGASAFAGALFAAGWQPVAWAFVAVAFAAAGGAERGASSRRRAAVLAGTAAGALGGIAVSSMLLQTFGLLWVMSDLAAASLIGGLAGAGVVVGQRTPEWVTRVRRRRLERSVDDRTQAASSDADPVRRAATRVEESAARVLALLDRLAAERPNELVLVDEIRRGVEQTRDGAAKGVARWAVVRHGEEQRRAVALRSRIEANEAQAEAAPSAALRVVIEQTVARQRAALDELEAVDARRQVFAFRLEQAEAGLELLQLSVERAVTEGDELDHAEVDVLVDTLNEAHAFFVASDADAGAETASGVTDGNVAPKTHDGAVDVTAPSEASLELRD